LKPLSFVIVTYNRPKDMVLLAENISRLQDLGELVEEILIVNNHSTVSYAELEAFIAGHAAQPSSADQAGRSLADQAAHPEQVSSPDQAASGSPADQTAAPFRYLVTPENLGVSGGRNYGIRQSKAPILVFLDDDALIQNPDALRQIVAIFGEQAAGGVRPPSDERAAFGEEAPSARPIGIAAFKVYYYETMTLQQNAFPHKRFEERKDWPHFDTAYFSGCAHAIRRKVFEEVGYYPENFFYGMEEYDLSYRALNAGFRIRYDDRVIILHKESPAGRLPPREKLRGMWVNKSTVAWKYLPVRFFVTTAFLWSLEYLQKSGMDLSGFWKGWRAVARIPGKEKRNPLNKDCLSYLKKVKARLTY
jgi:GT2 family glycosyltransferase